MLVFILLYDAIFPTEAFGFNFNFTTCSSTTTFLVVFFAGQFKSKDQTALLRAICSLWGKWKASTSEDTKGYPIGVYMFKVNNRNTRTRCEICSKLAMFKVMFLMISFCHIKTFCEVQFTKFVLQKNNKCSNTKRGNFSLLFQSLCNLAAFKYFNH